MCHYLSWFKKLSPTHTHPLQNHSWIFDTLSVIIFWVRVTHKMLNVTCIKIHSIILSVTCDGLRKYPLLIHIPLISIYKFLKPCELLFFELESLCKKLNVTWDKNSLNNFMCHLSWFKKLSPIHTHPFKIHWWIFDTLSVITFWVRVTHKMLNVTCIKIHSVILCVTCDGLRNFPLLIHIPLNPSVNFQNPMSYYFLS